jgi:hypothetical protein
MKTYKLRLLCLGAATVGMTIILLSYFWFSESVAHSSAPLRFQPRPDRLVRISRVNGRADDRETIHIVGQLDSNGTFMEDVEVPILVVGEWSVVQRSFIHPKEMRSVEITNLKQGRPCFEYRSGTLVQGFFDDVKRFVPLIGSKVLDFKTYKPGPRAIPIYNLPGEFVEAPPPGSPGS